MSKLTYSARKSMPKSSFALPAKKSAGNPAGKGAYPIPDANHARDALSRVSANGSPAEKKEVRAKVHKKFPGIGQKSPSAPASHEAFMSMTHGDRYDHMTSRRK